MPPTLYITAALSRINKERLGVMVTAKSEQNGTTHVAVTKSNINITKLLKNVNPRDGKFLKYVPNVPNKFLTKEQKQAKQAAIEARAREYARYGKKGQGPDGYRFNIEKVEDVSDPKADPSTNSETSGSPNTSSDNTVSDAARDVKGENAGDPAENRGQNFCTPRP